MRDEFREVERLRGMKCFPGGETQFVGNAMTNWYLNQEHTVSVTVCSCATYSVINCFIICHVFFLNYFLSYDAC